MTRAILLEQSADELTQAAQTAQRAAIEINAAAVGLTDTSDPEELMRRAFDVAAESHRLASAALTVRAAASRMGAVGVLAKEANGG